MKKVIITSIMLICLISGLVHAAPVMEEEDQIIVPPLIENGVTLPSIKPLSGTLPNKALDAKTASREEIIEAFSHLSSVPFLTLQLQKFLIKSAVKPTQNGLLIG